MNRACQMMLCALMMTAAFGCGSAAWAKNPAPSDKVSDFLVEYATKLYKQGNYAEARGELKKALMLNPGNSAALELIKKIDSRSPNAPVAVPAARPAAPVAVQPKSPKETAAPAQIKEPPSPAAATSSRIMELDRRIQDLTKAVEEKEQQARKAEHSQVEQSRLVNEKASELAQAKRRHEEERRQLLKEIERKESLVKQLQQELEAARMAPPVPQIPEEVEAAPEPVPTPVPAPVPVPVPAPIKMPVRSESIELEIDPLPVEEGQLEEQEMPVPDSQEGADASLLPQIPSFEDVPQAVRTPKEAAFDAAMQEAARKNAQ